jgi:hypothetical protein
MTPKKKIQLCIFVNFLLLMMLSTLMFEFASDSKYFRFGPHEDFVLVSVQINTYSKYYLLLFIITILGFTEVMIEDLGLPILTFNIYNPDKKVITDFTKNELQIYGNLMFLINNLRYILQVLITVTQIDIAILLVLVQQSTAILTIRFLLNEKKYSKNYELLRPTSPSSVSSRESISSTIF